MSDQKEKSVTVNKNQWQEKISVARNGHFFSLILRISTCEKSKFQGKFIFPNCQRTSRLHVSELEIFQYKNP